MTVSFVDAISDRITRWIGSISSLVVHTIVFVFVLTSHWTFGWSVDTILLVLTTVVSLEAIYISIFIQRAVNQQGERLEDVEESIDDVEEALDDVEEALDDVEEALDEAEDEETLKKLQEPIQAITAQMEALLKELSVATKKAKKKEDQSK